MTSPPTRTKHRKSRREALRCLKRDLARRVFELLQPPTPAPPPTPLGGRPPLIAKAGHMIHCNTPAGMPVLT
jgi:hypothetical protein